MTIRTLIGEALAGLVAVVLLSGAGCPSRIAIVANPDDAAYVDADDTCAHVCAKLASTAFSCPAGSNPECAPGCRRDQAQGVGAVIDTACILAASTKAQVAACGVSCP